MLQQQHLVVRGRQRIARVGKWPEAFPYFSLMFQAIGSPSFCRWAHPCITKCQTVKNSPSKLMSSSSNKRSTQIKQAEVELTHVATIHSPS
jgi:hypothetical protein